MAANTRRAMGPTRSSTAAKMGTLLESRSRTAAGSARNARAHDRATWAHRQSKSKDLAPHFRVTPGRVRHFATDDPSGPLTMVCDAAADPRCDGEAILAVVEESVEDRYLDVDRKTLKARLVYLIREAEHVAESKQNQALMSGGVGTNDALRKHARMLREICALRVRLGLEETVN